MDAESGFVAGTRGAVGSDAIFPTRLGEPQVTIVLARRRSDRLIPWADHDDEPMAWSLSEVTASRKRFERLLPDQNSPEIQSVKESWPGWKSEAYVVGVVDVSSGTIGDHLLYDEEIGLRAFSPPPRG